MSIFMDYAARGRTQAWRYPLTVALALVLAATAAVMVFLPLEMLGWLPRDLADRMLAPRHPALFFGATGVIFGLLLAGFVLAIRIVHRKALADVLGRWSWPGFGQGAGIWLAVLLALTLIDFGLAPGAFKVTATGQTASLFAWTLASLAIQTFAEEFVFRGYLTQGLLLAFRRPLPTALASGVLFGALHLSNGLPQAANALVLGVVLALIAIRTGGLAFGWGLHLANNLFGAVVVVSSGDVFKGSPGLFSQTSPQLMWWDMIASGLAILMVGAFVLRPGRAAPWVRISLAA